jgi:hypothetical protein
MAKIDPAFQAGTVLKDEYSPVEFAARAHAEKFQLQKAQYEEHEKQTAEGLKDLMLNLKGWEDKEGFQELLGRQQKAIDGFMSLSRKGMNLVNPKSAQEVMAYKALNDYHAKTKEMADQWQQQKTAYDLIEKELAEDAKLDPNEQKFDHAQTQKNLQEMLNTHSIEDRRGLLESAIVPQPQIADIGKFLKENEDAITKPKKITTYQENPATKQLESTMVDEESPKLIQKQVSDVEKLYKIAPPKVKEAIRRARKTDPTNDSTISDGTWLAMQRLPKFKEQMSIKPIKTGSGFSIDIGGAKGVKMSQGEHRTNASPIGGREFNDRYDFTTNKSFQVSTVKGEKWESVPDEKEGTTGWAPINDNGKVKAQLLFYDVKSKQLIFKADETEDMPYMRKNSIFAVPVENIPEAKDFPITKDDGTKGKLGDIIGTESTAKKKSYNPKTHKFE